MDRKILDHVRQLTSADPKSLVEKGLKASSEAGELSSAVLSFANVAGAQHRFVGREAVLDEVADVILAALSIAYDVGATDEEVEAEIHRKAVKWEGIQKAESGARFPLPFEIHVTVERAEVDAFRATCATLGVKPIILALHLRSGGELRDMQTSSVFHGDNQGSLAEARRISDGLSAAGFRVLREKIETVPWHPAAPSTRRPGLSMEPGCYFEAHLNVVCTEARRPLLKLVAEGHGAHLSRNAYKILEDGSFTIMVTHRAHSGTEEEFRADLAVLSVMLREAGFSVAKEIVEYSIHDTRPEHDAAWTAGAEAA